MLLLYLSLWFNSHLTCANFLIRALSHHRHNVHLGHEIYMLRGDGKTFQEPIVIRVVPDASQNLSC
jgi:hypothetical protein